MSIVGTVPMTETTSQVAVLSPRKRRMLLTAAAIATVVYVAVTAAIDTEQLKKGLGQLGLGGCAAVLGLSLLNYILRFVRWHLYLRQIGHSVPVPQHLLYYLSGFAFTVSPAKAGEVFRSVYLREHGVSYAQSIGALFVERLLDLLAMVLLAALIIADHAEYRFLLGIVLLVLVGLIVVICQQGLPQLLHTRFTDRRSRISSFFLGLAHLLETSRQLLRPAVMAFAAVCGVAAWLAQGFALYFVAHAFDIPIGAAAAVGTYAIAVLAGNAAIVLPGGVGGTEIVMSALLLSYGATLGTAILATLVCSLATLWFAVVVGVLAAATIEFRTSLHSPPATP